MSKSIQKQLAAQNAQEKRNQKRRLSHVEEQLLKQFRCDYQTIQNEMQLKVCKRLANLGYLHAIGGESFGITEWGIDYMHAHNITLRSE